MNIDKKTVYAVKANMCNYCENPEGEIKLVRQKNVQMIRNLCEKCIKANPHRGIVELTIEELFEFRLGMENEK